MMSDRRKYNGDSSAAVVTGAAPVKTKSERVADGKAAWERRKANADKSFADWLLIGEALVIGRKQCQAQARAPKAAGKAYNDRFGSWLKTHYFDDIDGSDRSKLFKIMEHRAEIEEWRANLEPAQRAAWNHPSTIWRVATCRDRGLPAFRHSPPEDVDEELEPEIGKNEARRRAAKSPNKWIVEANKSTGIAKDVRSFRGEVGPAFREALREAAEAWAETFSYHDNRAGGGRRWRLARKLGGGIKPGTPWEDARPHPRVASAVTPPGSQPPSRRRTRSTFTLAQLNGDGASRSLTRV